MMNLNLTDRTSEFSQEDIEDSKAISGIAYLWILFFLPIVAKPNSKFGKFHANQALLLLFANVITNFALGIAAKAINFITFGFLKVFTSLLLGAVNLIFFVIIIAFLLIALGGKAYELPFIGKIRILK